MGGWNPVADVAKAVENVTREVSNTVSTAGKVVGNVGNLVGGDVGKVINAGTAPIGGMVQAGGDLIGGNVQGSLSRQAGAMLSSVSSPVAASTTVNELARSDFGDVMTLGMSGDLSEANLASKRMINNGEITAQDWSTMGRLGARTALLVSGAGVVSANSAAIAGGISNIGTSMGAGLATAGTAATTAAGGAATAVAGNEINKILNPTKTAEQASTAAPKSKSWMPLILVAGVGTLLLIILKRK